MPSTIPHDPFDDSHYKGERVPEPVQPQPGPGFDDATDALHAAELDRITALLAEGRITVSDATRLRREARVALSARNARPGEALPAPEDAPERQHIAELAHIARLLHDGRITRSEAEHLRVTARFAMNARIALATSWVPGGATFDVAARAYVESLLPPALRGAEAAAQVTAASAVLADFERASYAYAMEGAERPDWATWAQRLAIALGAVLDITENHR